MNRRIFYLNFVLIIKCLSAATLGPISSERKGLQRFFDNKWKRNDRELLDDVVIHI
jgi:hypothetical protein